jgi:diaminohydroxyphosphoribosylaminopyrimidine deaminase/5-amino-6-(5-phosphoribosylamino)uracil reductase
VLREYMDIEGMRPRDPVRVVVDPQLSLLPELYRRHLSKAGNMRRELPELILICSQDARQTAGFDIDTLPVSTTIVEVTSTALGQLNLQEAFFMLGGIGITGILVEGGARLAQELIAQQAADFATLVYTPLLLGADALGFTPQLGLATVQEAPRAELQSAEQLGADVALSLVLR